MEKEITHEKVSWSNVGSIVLVCVIAAGPHILIAIRFTEGYFYIVCLLLAAILCGLTITFVKRKYEVITENFTKIKSKIRTLTNRIKTWELKHKK